MTNFVLAPTRTWSYVTGYATPRTMLEQGMLTAYTQRANGTLRHLDLAPLGSTRRDTAEYVSERINDGASVAAVARELHVSNATVRRYLLSLDLTEEIEADEWEGVLFNAQGEPEWDALYEVEYLAEDSEAVTEETVPVVEPTCGWDRCANHGSGDEVAADQPCPGAGADLELLDQLADSLDAVR